jgi:hypothetical protein
MTRLVIEPVIALASPERGAAAPGRHKLSAPTLLKSQGLAE